MAKKSKKIRPLGEILLDLEIHLEELTDDHELQTGDILNLIKGWIDVHRPGAHEQYIDGDTPIFYYGPKKDT